MGQTHSSEQHPQTPANPILHPLEELSRRLAERFADQCFSGVELYSFKDNFRTLADVHRSETGHGGLLYWSEETLVKFLAIPDCLDVGAILFRAVSYIGAFPFPSLAPVVLDFEALVKVVVILTGRYKSVIRRRRPDSLRLLFRALAVYDRGIQREGVGEGEGEGKGKAAENVDFSLEDDEDEEDEDDLSLAALDALDAIEVFGQAERSNIHHARIPLDNLRKLIAFLIVIAPLEPNQPIAAFADRLTPDALVGVRDAAESILRGFRCKDEKGVLYRDFKTRIKRALPYMFTPLEPLFEHFLFSKKVDMSTPTPSNNPEPLIPLLSAEGEILDLNLLSQLSFSIPGTHLWRRLRLLYAGSEAGFSMGSFETKVLKWAAPTLLLVSGTRIPTPTQTHSQQAFLDRIPSKKYPPSTQHNSSTGRLVFGVFLNIPWKLSHKGLSKPSLESPCHDVVGGVDEKIDCFGDAASLLFQLEPVHEVFAASKASGEYAYFNKDDGIGFGSPVQKPKHHHQRQGQGHLNLGPVSLTFDHSLEYGVFQNTGNGGAYHTTGDADYYSQDLFEIEEIEVWGCGGSAEAEAQRKAWAWEEREALLRRQITLGKDIEADRALLEMAGLVGQNRSGGSLS
ncbi:TLDc domain-containing protein 2 [Choiromyces venosus 120613-1]|uniref:Restriction of telomere capping protein 5 n=1 Tax=Choiromyces venosus 120613-1 TaxID=1336337 RepID=A0A3N4JGR5_9PEZI|nr:TLDc domain-containing protein 2 [Choiromyces venosus 120613-1]